MSVVAVITRTKNRPLFLKRAIESVRAQVYQDWIHVIVNDGGSREPVDELVRSFPKSYQEKCKTIHLPNSMGMEAASNQGIRAVESTYITVLDDDDSWDPQFLMKTVHRLKEKRFPTIRGVVTFADRIVEKVEGEAIRRVSKTPFNHYLESIRLDQMAGENFITTNSFLFEREAWNEIGPFDETLPVLGDWEFNLRFLSRYDIDLIEEPLSYFHHRSKEQQGRFANSGVGGKKDHVFYSMLIRNRLLRSDLSAGRFGLGSVLMLGWGFKDLCYRITHLRKSMLLPRVSRTAKTWVGKILSQ